MSGGFTDGVKQELARQPLPHPGDGGDVELAWVLRCAGSLVRSGTPARTSLAVETTSGAVARRVFALLHTGHGRRPALQVRAAGGVHRRTSFALRVDDDAEQLATDLGLVDDRGLPTPAPSATPHPVAALRGALLGAGSLSDPGRAPHLEVRCHDDASARALARAVAELTEGHASVVADGERARMVVKSGATIALLLAALEVEAATRAWEEQRSRRRLRADATRLANADAANVQRSVRAAAAQVDAVERLVAAHGWEGLDDDLRTVALVRLTSPEASLAELGQLADPPLSRSTVHRRLARLTDLAAQVDDAGGAPHHGG